MNIPPDCRDLGMGHDFVKFDETENTIRYVCLSCGKEMFEDKMTMFVTPPRLHGTEPK